MEDKTQFSENMVSVTEVNATIKACVDSPVFKNLDVFGEVSGFKMSGPHAYFSLKDNQSQIACVCFYAAKTYKPKDGESVILRGAVDYYVKGGRLSFNASSITPVGQGLLFLEFEKLKAKLNAEGLFAAEHKKTIPAYAKEICVVTSKTGAVIRDIVTTVRRKNPVVNIIVKDVRVQGAGAAAEIVAALGRVDRLGFDVIILARGGGSLEDLAPFYDEQVVRAVFNTVTPIISAVGHETDFSLADFAADARAATPTAAAELAAYDYYALVNSVKRDAERLSDAVKKLYARKLMRGRLACQKLTAEASGFYAARCHKIEILAAGMRNSVGRLEINAEHRLDKASEKLDSLSPVKTLRRGYFSLQSGGKHIVKVASLKVGDDVNASGSDGSFTATVKKIVIDKDNK